MARNRLPVVGSTAATTGFCSVRLVGPGDRHLWLDGNGKITAHNGTLAAPSPNAFSLLQIDDCPQHTDTCARSCYVHNLQVAQPDLHALYAHNSATIREILVSDERLEWAVVMARRISSHARGGFRWHVSGDVFSTGYAFWIATVVQLSPTVTHWIYTRSFAHAAPLVPVTREFGGSLSLNLSCDRDNFGTALQFRQTWGVGRLCYLTVADEDPSEIPDLGSDGVIFPDYGIRPRQFATIAESPWWQSLRPKQRSQVCPVDAHGKSEARRCGPCDRCLR